MLSDEHFSVDGTLIQAWASTRSYRPKDGSDDEPGGGGRNKARDFHGETRSNESHASTTDPQARLCYMGRAVSENRHGLVVEVKVSEANGTAERSSSAELIETIADEAPCTVAADKAYDTRGFVAQLRKINATPHVAQNTERNGGSAIDGRTTRHAGYALSLKARKLIEEAFGWGKDIGLLRRPKYRGRDNIEYATLLTFTGYNLVCMRNLLAPDFR